MRTLLSVTLTLSLLAPAVVLAQSAPAGPALETEVRRKRLVVRPPLDGERARRDAARAAAPEAIARDLDAADIRRPDTAYDVRQAIQQRSLSRAGRAGQSGR